MIKWAAAFLGYFIFRFPGAIFGFFIGSLIDQFSKGSTQVFGKQTPTMARAEFELYLLALAATVIKADGQTKKQELEFVRNFFISQYGTAHASQLFQKFNTEVKEKSQNIEEIAAVLVRYTQHAVRLQILHFLFGIANADGSISDSELQKLEQIGRALRINTSDYGSIKAMFVKSTDGAYSILEITPDATDAEVKKAYRNMAKKYHPDALQSKDVALLKGAKEKFQKVQEAYEIIQKQRGM